MQKEQVEVLIQKVQKLMESHIHHQGKSLKEFVVIANELVKNLSSNSVIEVEEKAANLYEHTVMVTLLSLLIAKKMKLSEAQQYDIAIGCLLHDIGMRYITVTSTEFDTIEYKKHPILGYSALEKESWIPEVSLKMILLHHEKMDGTGFPMKQKNKQIACKIIQLCDTFDRMISGIGFDRMEVAKAREEIASQAGMAYDAKAVSFLLSIV